MSAEGFAEQAPLWSATRRNLVLRVLVSEVPRRTQRLSGQVPIKYYCEMPRRKNNSAQPIAVMG